MMPIVSALFISCGEEWAEANARVLLNLLSATQDPQAIECLTLEKLQDGFAISQYDLQLRGPGDLLRNLQSGVPGFVLANVISDGNMLEAARTDAAYDLIASGRCGVPLIYTHIQEALKKAAYID